MMGQMLKNRLKITCMSHGQNNWLYRIYMKTMEVKMNVIHMV